MDEWFKRIERLFREHQGYLVGQVAAVTKNRDLAEDAVQNVIVRLLRDPDRFSGMPELRGYVLVAARNEARNLLARERRMTVCPSWDLPRPTSMPRPEDSLEAYELAGQLAAAILHLPPQMRKVLLLRRQGYEIGEIAETLGTTRGTVKVQLHRVRKRLAPAVDAAGETSA